MTKSTHPDSLSLIYPDEFTNVRDWLLIKHPDLIGQITKISVGHSFKNFNDINPKDYNKGSALLSQQAFLQVISETVFDYPSVFVSEKTIKPIVSKRPFVIVGSPGCLANIKAVGFKTFDRYWDESYDSIQDSAERMLAIVNIIEFICSKSIDELKKLCLDMQDILDYNFEYHVNNLRQLEFEKFNNQCIQNLKHRNV
jgi:hypothetical protein